MKICYISNSSAPSKNASSLQTAKLCEEISRLGHNVNLILPKTEEFKKDYFKFYDIKHKFKITRLKYFKKFPIGLDYYLYSFFSILASNFKKQDLYITRNFFCSFLLSLLNKKQLFEIHDDILIEGRVINFLVKNLKFLNRNSVLKIITTTKTLKKRYEKYGIKKDKIFVLHNASSLQPHFNKYRKKINKLNIGYFGSIFRSRGIEMILKISKIDYKNNYYIYGGTKKQILELKKKVENKNIYFQPYIPYSNIFKKLKKIDVCILPYTSKITVAGNVGDISNYTSPLKLFDYMKLGKLILCSNLKVLREVLNHNENSILVDNFTDEKNWLKKINKISNNFNKFDRIRESAFKYAKLHDLKWRTSKLLSFHHLSN